ncbi:MAG: DUF2490 domain-containing protein [Fidelibacterota bacterium]|nr:MAG: DUF2490 domain-containing protein [Candidatus Neomarinimicrobiota bacterium]
MMFHRSLIAVCLVLIALAVPQLSQAGSPPAQLWSSMVISKQSSRGIKAELEHQLRSRLERPAFKETYYELRLSFPIQMGFGVTLFYRQVFYPDNTAWRLAAAPQLNAPFGLDWLKLRLKFQRHAPHGEQARSHARFRTTFTLPLSEPCTLFFQAEPWWQLDAPIIFSRYRLDAGLQRKWPGGWGFEMYYRLQGDKKGTDWQGTDIFGLKLKAAL